MDNSRVHYWPASNVAFVSDLDGSASTATVTLLGNGELDSLALGQRNPGLVLANDENVALTGGEAVVDGVLDVDNVEATIVTLTVGDDTNTTHVATTGDHRNGTSVELDEVGDLAGGKINLDSIVDLDQGVRVSNAISEHKALANPLGRFEGDTLQPLKPLLPPIRLAPKLESLSFQMKETTCESSHKLLSSEACSEASRGAGFDKIDQSLVQRLNDV